MRYFLLFILCIVVGFAGEQRKIILSSYKKSSIAIKDLASLQLRLSKTLLRTLKKENSHIKARKSGKLHIIVIEPIKNRKSALKIKSLLPKPFNKTGYINTYNPPANAKPALKPKKDTNQVKNTEKKEIIQIAKSEKPKEEEPTKIEEKKQESLENKIEVNTTVAQATEVKEIEKEVKKEEVAKKKEEKKEAEKKVKAKKETEKKSEVKKIEVKKKPKPLKNKEEKIIEETNIGFGFIAEAVKSGFISFVQYFTRLFMENIFIISLIIFVMSIFILFRVTKRKILVKRKMDLLNKEKEEKAMLAQSLKIELNHLKSRHINFTKSLMEPIETLQNKFDKSSLEPSEKETAQIVNTIAQILTSFQELGEHISMDESEFNLNAVVSSVVKQEKLKCEEGISVIKDFDLPMLKKVVGDKQKVLKLFSHLIKFACLNTHIGRVFVALNQASQDVDGKVMIHVVIKGGKNGFSKNATKNITEAFSNRLLYDDINMPEVIHELKVAKRLIEAMNGSIEFIGGEGQESGFLFNLQLKVINRYALQETLLSKQHGLRMNIFLLGENDTQDLQNDLKSLSIEPQIFTSWEKLVISFKDIYVFVDIIILQNSFLPKINLEELIKIAKRKNFAIIIIIEENEMENKTIHQLTERENALDEEDRTTIKILQKPYNKNEFLSLLTKIHEEQKPVDLSSQLP